MKTQKKKFDVFEALAKLPKETLLAIAQVSEGDGHSIFMVEGYRKAGMPEDILNYFAKKHKSNTKDYKATIFGPDGKMIPVLYGIYGLDVVEHIRYALNLPRSHAMGRGFIAQHDYAEIVKACSPANNV